MIQIPDLVRFIYKYSKKYTQTDDASSSNVTNDNEENNIKLNAMSYIDSANKNIQTNTEECQKCNNSRKVIINPDSRQFDLIWTEMEEIAKRMSKMERKFDRLPR